MTEQRARLRTVLRTDFMAEEAIRSLLMQPDWNLQSFDEIKRHLRGFDGGEGNELRKLLVTAP